MESTASSYLSNLYCPECKDCFDPLGIQSYCSRCQSPLLTLYDLDGVKANTSPREIQNRGDFGLWRWHELLPVRDPQHRVTLGEGNTPLLPVPHVSTSLGLEDVRIKDESLNPTGTFKARGLAVAVSKAKELGLKTLVLPTAGNAGGALATYAARAGLEAHVFMPQDAPKTNQEEVRVTGASLHLVNGLISDAGKIAAEKANKHNWFSVATFKEPYRVEGKKTLGFELAEQSSWELPDVIIYPTGGGTGLVGMWKAFDELQTLGWIGPERPRMVTVQAAGCAPIVKAIEEGSSRTEPWKDASTIADGLRVPHVFADRLVLQALRESEGTALSVTDREIQEAQAELGQMEGIFAAPEGAATLAALKRLSQNHWIAPEERVILFNTGSGLKYIH